MIKKVVIIVKYNLISYLIGDGIKNITKNKKSTFSAVIIMFVTMLTIGICFIIGENVNFVLDKIKKEYPLEIYIDDEISTSQKEELKNKIKNIKNVNPNIKELTKEEVYYKAQEKLGEEMTVAYTEKEHPWPATLIITFTNLDEININDISNEIKSYDHVDVSEEEQTAETSKLVMFAKGVNITLIAIGGILIIFSMIIIGNTIKLTVHARRKEISIMKYVGATNNFIRAPFVVEGVVIGIISSALSLIALAGLYVWLKNYVIGIKLGNWLEGTGISNGFELLEFSSMFSQILLVFLVLGIGIGIIGSIRSMRKYLKV